MLIRVSTPHFILLLCIVVGSNIIYDKIICHTKLEPRKWISHFKKIIPNKKEAAR